jgi:hypothetical protein
MGEWGKGEGEVMTDFTPLLEAAGVAIILWIVWKILRKIHRKINRMLWKITGNPIYAEMMTLDIDGSVVEFVSFMDFSDLGSSDRRIRYLNTLIHEDAVFYSEKYGEWVDAYNEVIRQKDIESQRRFDMAMGAVVGIASTIAATPSTPKEPKKSSYTPPKPRGFRIVRSTGGSLMKYADSGSLNMAISMAQRAARNTNSYTHFAVIDLETGATMWSSN